MKALFNAFLLLISEAKQTGELNNNYRLKQSYDSISRNYLD